MGGSHQAVTSVSDRQFMRDFENCTIAPEAFSHQSHLRLAYCSLSEHELPSAQLKLKESLQAFLHHHNVPAAKYHETLTQAWMMAVDFFMSKTPGTQSFAAFCRASSPLMDSNIMLTHYSKDVLFSDAARQSFVPPDIQSIPPPQA